MAGLIVEMFFMLFSVYNAQLSPNHHLHAYGSGKRNGTQRRIKVSFGRSKHWSCCGWQKGKLNREEIKAVVM